MRSAGSYRFPECAPVGHPARSSGSDSLRETAVARTLTDITKTFGTSFVPDVFTGMSGRPAYLEAAWELFQDDVGLCKMDGETRRIIALAVTTNESGIYYIAVYPHVFRLNLGHDTCDKVAYFIWMVSAFERFLSGLPPREEPQAARFVIARWYEEYDSDGAAMAFVRPLRTGDAPVESSWMEKAIVVILILAILAIGAFLVSL